MSSTLTRRSFAAMAGSLLAGGLIAHPAMARAEKAARDAFTRKLVEIEKGIGTRLGVFVLDTRTGQDWTHRADERFPMCSTNKVLTTSAVLTRVDAGREDLSRRIRFEADDVDRTYSPVLETRFGGDGMTLAEICEASMTYSDNTAGNLIMKSLGGPSGATAFARSLGDTVTRQDRFAPHYAEATPGDPRDTTTPAAMAANLRTLFLGDSLSPRSREQLTAWFLANTTGDARLRAGLPKSWRIGDKTGSGYHGTTNDVAVIWPPDRAPLVVCVYSTGSEASYDDREAAVAEVGRALTDAPSRTTE